MDNPPPGVMNKLLIKKGIGNFNNFPRHQIIKYGKLAYMESEEIKVFFEVKVLKVYMDMEPFRRTQMKYISEWIEKNSGSDS